MSRSRQIQILPAGSDAALSPDQLKFNALIRQIEQGRASLQAWQDATLQFGQTYRQLIAPLETELRTVRRAWVLAADAASRRKGWTKGERVVWNDLVCETAGQLLAAGTGDDAELRALYEQHAKVDFEDERKESLQIMKAMAEAVSGMDLGDVDEIADEAQLFERLQRKAQEQAAAAEAQRAQAKPPPRHGKTAAQKRRESEAHEASLSVREVYRKLASALHPDRESDAALRERKTALMQQVNQAYAKEDLLALLELQLRVEQIDAGDLRRLDPGRLKHYIKVLKEQLAELKREISGMQLDFCMDFNLDLRTGMKPDKLGQILHRQAQDMRAHVAHLKMDMRRFDDQPATKAWLKVQRRRMEMDDMEEDDMWGLPF